MFDDGDFDWRKALIAKTSLLLLHLSKPYLIGLEHVLCELELFGP
jgi:hypothetical protein